MDKTDQLRTLAELTVRHPEVAVELVDRNQNIRYILFNGMDHPECLPSGGKRAFLEDEDPVQAITWANLYSREGYEDSVDAEMLAKGLSLDEAIRRLRD